MYGRVFFTLVYKEWNLIDLENIIAFHVFQEEELRKGGEAKYAHLSMELHVFIEVMAPISEAYMRMAHAMEEVKKFLIPVCVSITQTLPITSLASDFQQLLIWIFCI